MTLRRGLLILVALLALIILSATVWVKQVLHEPGPLAGETIVFVERGASLAQIGDTLAAAGVIRYPKIFAALARSVDPRRVKAGEYAFPSGISLADSLRWLESGQLYRRRITLPEGLTSREVAARLLAEPLLTGEVAVPPEGTLLPDTYDFLRGDTRQSLVLRMQKAMQDTAAQIWATRTPNLPLQDSTALINLAAIVEKETGLRDERARVAGVFVNRLRLNMPLQSDPTVIYALTQGQRDLGRPLLRKDWDFPSPYNTYQQRGLPPTPIANPGRAALMAAAHPEAHDFLYFVADGTGGHAFAQSLKEHNRNNAAARKVTMREAPESAAGRK